MLARSKIALFAFACGLSLALALGAAPARAQEEWTPIYVEDLGTNDALVGKRISVEAKIVLISGTELLVRDTDVLFRLQASAAQAAQTLREGDNIRAYGVVVRVEGGQRKFAVSRVEVRPDDAVIFREELEQAKARKDRAALFLVAERAEREAARAKNEAVRETALEAYRTAIEIEAAAAAPGDVAACVRLADLYVQKLGDRKAALEWLVKAFPKGEFPPPGVRDRLTSPEVNAVPYAGDWVLYEEMKRREGFVQRGDEWVLAERAAFLDAIDAQIKNPRRDRIKSDPNYLIDAATRGLVEYGMVKKEVALAIGFPDAVDRVRRIVGGQQRTFDAWYYEGRGQFVFEDDVLFRKP